MRLRRFLSGTFTVLTALDVCTLCAERPGTNPVPTNRLPVERFGDGPTLPVMILLHGVSGPSDFYREQAGFFAKHGYRVLLPHYLEAGHGQKASDENYAAWVTAVRKIVNNSQRDHGFPVVVVGYSLGASVALALGSQGQGPDAIAEFYGSLPDRYFHELKGMPPLLILHGGEDGNIPVYNALQLSRLCSLAALKCESHIYPDQGHGFSAETLRDADKRVLMFFSGVLRR